MMYKEESTAPSLENFNGPGENLYPDLDIFKDLPVMGLEEPKNKVSEKEVIDLVSKIMRLLLNFKIEVSQEQEIVITQYIRNNYQNDLGKTLYGLYLEKILEKTVLIQALGKNALPKDSFLHAWWEEQKNKVKIRHLHNNSTSPKNKQSSSSKLDSFLKINNQKQLIDGFKTELTEFARMNFYVYRSGYTYYYSPFPNEESIGGRCNQEGKPLTDEFGNALTDELGDFRYAIITARETSSGNFEEIKTVVTRDTPGATFLTDKNGKSLATTYRELIAKEKPKNSNRQRAEAINNLFQLIDIASAEEIFRYIMTPNFQNLVGANEFHLDFWRKGLANICKKFTDTYQQISVMGSDENLLEVLLDETLYTSLTPDKLSTLFWNYNPLIVADVIINIYENTRFNFQDLDYQFLLRLLNCDQEIIYKVNKKRCELKTKLLLPLDSRVPGKNLLEEEKLTKLQLFQYDDKTIAAAEQWIRNQFKHLLINRQNFDSFEYLNKETPYYFYQIPANSYMLLDPLVKKDPNYYRYRQLKKDLPKLINDPNIILFKKPVIFFGILNVDGNHYISYFIYKNKNSKIFVLTVDSSPHTYPEERQDNQHIDSKKETYLKIKGAFLNIFPECTFIDPAITQMLRQRDCGPNSAQTNVDALEKALSITPLLIIDDSDALQIDVQQLTVVGYPHGINPYTETFVYSPQVETHSSHNRTIWQERLSQTNIVQYCVRQINDKISIFSSFYPLVEEYNYVEQVNKQTIHDERNINISAIQSLLLSDEEGRRLVNEVTEQYKKTLQIPNLNNLGSFIKSKTDSTQLQQYTSAHQKNIMLLLEDVTTVILKDFIPEALGSALEVLILSHLPNRTDLNPEKIVADFLLKHQDIFRKLSSHDQSIINASLQSKAEKAVQKKLLDLHTKLVIDLFTRNCQSFLTKIPANYSIDSFQKLMKIVITHLEFENVAQYFSDNKYKSDAINQAFAYLKAYDFGALIKIVEQKVTEVSNIVFKSTLQYARKQLKFNDSTLRELLSYFDSSQVLFLPPSPGRYLPLKATINYLAISEINSALGMWIIPNLYQNFIAEISSIFAGKIKEKVKEFVSLHPFDFSHNNVMEIDSWLDDNDQLIFLFGHTTYISQHGKPQTIMCEDYLHIMAHKQMQDELQLAFQHAIKQIRNKRFLHIAKSILAANREKLTFNEFNYYNIDEDLVPQLFNFAFAANKELHELYLKEFCLLSPENKPLISQCGIRFNEYLLNHYVKPILVNYPKGFYFINDIQVVIHYLTILKEMNISNINQKILAPYAEKLNNLLRNVENFNLIDNFENRFKILIDEFRNILFVVLSSLFYNPGYSFGEIQPGSISVFIRPTLCSLLGIDSETILSFSTAKELDEKIRNLIEKMREDLKGPRQFDFIFKQSSLLIMKPQKNLPVTYNKALTPELLVDLLSFWYCNGSFNIFSFNQNEEPALIKQLIAMVNDYYVKAMLDNQNIAALKNLLPTKREDELALFSKTDILSKIMAAILKTKDFAGELKPSLVSFTQLTHALRGENFVAHSKKSNSKPIITLEEFNKIVTEEYSKRKLKALEEAAQNKEELSSVTQIFLKDVRAEFAEQYTVEGIEDRPVITRREFEQRVIKELQSRNRFAHDNGQKPSTLQEIRDEFGKLYLIESNIDKKEKEEEEELAINYVPREQLQRHGIKKLSFFGNSELNKYLTFLKARHESDDYLDDYDMEQLRLQLLERWNKLILMEKGNAAINHYLKEKPSQIDSEYLLLASLLAQHYRRQGKMLYIYDLLMPKYFPSPDSLKAHVLPEHINKEIQEISKSDQLYDIEEKKKFDIKLTIDDIPLISLVITRSGYAFNINWILHKYFKETKLINFYTNEELFEDEIDDILAHPASGALVDRVMNNCSANVTPRMIDLLEKYILGTVFEYGFGADYSEKDQRASEYAAQVFRDELKKYPHEAKALMKEPIPLNANNDTVEIILNNSTVSCISYQGLQLAKVIIAYKGKNHNLPEFILKKLGAATIEKIQHKEYVVNIAKYSKAEQYILKQASENRIAFSI